MSEWRIGVYARDNFRFHLMMLKGCQLDGTRILSPKTIELINTRPDMASMTYQAVEN
ncbi:MAG: hypothetical protein O3C43_12220 [Verrucomicrobia bacterium]|nr:hypothetical protein [Verrucomicrobiota bacterium]MDA1067258.1 hypothetical protein [Verrucomicrobiota bacterium]